MAASITFTYDRGPGPVKRIIADWTSAADGSATATTTVKASGRLVKGTTDPGATAPTDNYDITVKDDEGVDVLAACQTGLADRDTANSEEQYFLVKDAAPLAQSVHPVVCSPLTIVIANAGDSKQGQLILFLEGELSGNF